MAKLLLINCFVILCCYGTNTAFTLEGVQDDNPISILGTNHVISRRYSYAHGNAENTVNIPEYGSAFSQERHPKKHRRFAYIPFFGLINYFKRKRPHTPKICTWYRWFNCVSKKQYLATSTPFPTRTFTRRTTTVPTSTFQRNFEKGMKAEIGMNSGRGISIPSATTSTTTISIPSTTTSTSTTTASTTSFKINSETNRPNGPDYDIDPRLG